MCLAVPGRVTRITSEASGGLGRCGEVDFAGNRTVVSLDLVPAAGVGAWVLVHAGLAIEVLDEASARETWQILREVGLVQGEAAP